MKDFKKYFQIPAEPELVYAALTQEATVALWTGAPAQMSTEPGSEFSLWDGDIVGKNLEFQEGKRIEQEWYFGDQEEPSLVTIKLHPDKKGCSFEVNHRNIPEESYDDIAEGWSEVYVASLIDFYTE